MPCLRFPDVVVPVSAQQVSADQVEVAFNVDLVAGALIAGNWQARAGITQVNAVTASVPGGGGASTVLVTLASSGTFVTVSYSPPPFDVVAVAGGVAADAFADFPVS